MPQHGRVLVSHLCQQTRSCEEPLNFFTYELLRCHTWHSTKVRSIFRFLNAACARPYKAAPVELWHGLNNSWDRELWFPETQRPFLALGDPSGCTFVVLETGSAQTIFATEFSWHVRGYYVQSLAVQVLQYILLSACHSPYGFPCDSALPYSSSISVRYYKNFTHTCPHSFP